MRTFNVNCTECGESLDVEIEESDLADAELIHAVVCEECEADLEFKYDTEFNELVDVTADDDDEEEDEPTETDAAEEAEGE